MTNAVIIFLSFTNCTPCSQFYASRNMTNWTPMFQLSRLDNRTNAWDIIRFEVKTDHTNEFWKVVPCPKDVN